MARKVVFGVVAGLLASVGVAYACSDTSCDASWKLSARSLDCSNRVFLNPGNDTRVNLLLLWRDRAGLGLKGLSQPAPSYESHGFGGTFLDWQTLGFALVPPPKDGEEREVPNYLGSICQSLASGGAGFAAALAANATVPPTERSVLTTARARVVAACESSGEATPAGWPANITSDAGKAFLGYLIAAENFYANRWEPAREGFAALINAPDAWVAETARYMVARSAVNSAQASTLDDSGWIKADATAADRSSTARAGADFAAYLSAYPNGRYAASAQGLERRVLWLAGDAKGLARKYDALMAKTPAQGQVAVDLVNEIDNKLLFPAFRRAPDADGAMQLAVLDMMRMRPAAEMGNSGGVKPITAEELAAQAPAFAGDPDLYGLLKATHAFHVGNDPRAVLTLIPDDSHRKDYSVVGFSRQVLRGMALAAVKDPNEAGFWRDLISGAAPLWQRPTAELGLAMNLERAGKVADVFAPASPIADGMIRRILLRNSANAEVLRGAAQDTARPQVERDTALFALLYNQLLRGDYAAFGRNLALVPQSAGSATDDLWDFAAGDKVPVGLFARGRFSQGGYACPALSQTAATLAKTPQDVRARLCLGEFVRINQLDDFGPLNMRPAADELGGGARGFVGPVLTRAEIYRSVMADRTASADDRAYALNRAIRCYAPSGNNACGGKDVSPAQRKAWFEQLRRDYPKSQWTRSLRYYW